MIIVVVFGGYCLDYFNMHAYLVFLKSKLKTKQIAVNTNPAVASMEYITSIAM